MAECYVAFKKEVKCMGKYTDDEIRAMPKITIGRLIKQGSI